MNATPLISQALGGKQLNQHSDCELILVPSREW